ncbi:uncharacterized protein LOC141605084 [Silene latifolia]|uniref:uncharacterized protein LOC141605084 n=1 Tax=Silene latifolia TaxID=37657 RepID=UPI003D77E424
MASYMSQATTAHHLNTQQFRRFTPPNPPRLIGIHTFKCFGFSKAKDDIISNPTLKKQKKDVTEPENVVLKVAWYASELLGIAASALQPSRPAVPADEYQELTGNASGTVDRAVVVDAIKQDFQRSYFVTGNLTLGAYEEDCEFADPAGSFKGLRRFKRNCTNFGSLIIKSNMKLMKWEDLEDKGIGHWRFSCVLSFPWRPILSATGYTEYYFDVESGKVIRHVENWNVPKMTLLKQILKPSGYNDRKDN